MIKLLVNAGASLTIKDHSGDDALSLAASAPTITRYIKGKLPKDYVKAATAATPASPLSGRSPSLPSKAKAKEKAAGGKAAGAKAGSATPPGDPKKKAAAAAEKGVKSEDITLQADGEKGVVGVEKLPAGAGGCCLVQ